MLDYLIVKSAKCFVKTQFLALNYFFKCLILLHYKVLKIA